MLDDLAMLANLTVVDVDRDRTAEADKAASETMPPPKRKRTSTRLTKSGRTVRRGQRAPEQEPAAEEDR